MIDKYRDNILGLKIRLSKGVVPDDKALDYLKRVIELADELDERLGTSLPVKYLKRSSEIPSTPPYCSAVKICFTSL